MKMRQCSLINLLLKIFRQETYEEEERTMEGTEGWTAQAGKTAGRPQRKSRAAVIGGEGVEAG